MFEMSNQLNTADFCKQQITPNIRVGNSEVPYIALIQNQHPTRRDKNKIWTQQTGATEDTQVDVFILTYMRLHNLLNARWHVREFSHIILQAVCCW